MKRDESFQYVSQVETWRSSEMRQNEERRVVGGVRQSDTTGKQLSNEVTRFDVK